MVKITGEYQGDLHCVATHEASGISIATDAPVDNGGKGSAFSPTDLLAAGLASCVCTIMAKAALTRGVELKGLRYEVTKEMSATPPRRISRLHLRIWLPATAKQMPIEILQRAANSCPVHQSLSPEIDKVIEFLWA